MMRSIVVIKLTHNGDSLVNLSLSLIYAGVTL